MVMYISFYPKATNYHTANIYPNLQPTLFVWDVSNSALHSLPELQSCLAPLSVLEMFHSPRDGMETFKVFHAPEAEAEEKRGQYLMTHDREKNVPS